jgi:uncharacterized RDD family membrane protein YckC
MMLLNSDQGATHLTTPNLVRRLACWLYEGFLLLGVAFISSYLFGALSGTKNAMDNRHALQAFLFVIFGIYFVWLWSKGQTLAMKTWHIRVVDLSGRQLSQARAMARYLMCWLWFLPPLMTTWLSDATVGATLIIAIGWVAVWSILSKFHSRQQFWHDALSGTQLVNASRN